MVWKCITLECRINMSARLLIFELFSRQHALTLHSVFIHSNIFDQKYQRFMFFRLQYAHFWALILVSIKFSRRHVYYFHKLFQQACLFRQARLFRTLEYILYRGGGTCSKLGAQLLNRGQNLGAQNLRFPSLRLKYWVRKCAPLRIRLHRPWFIRTVL